MSFFKFVFFVLAFLIIRRIYLNLRNVRFVMKTYRGPFPGAKHPFSGPPHSPNAPAKDEAIEAEYKVISQKTFQEASYGPSQHKE